MIRIYNTEELLSFLQETPREDINDQLHYLGTFSFETEDSHILWYKGDIVLRRKPSILHYYAAENYSEPQKRQPHTLLAQFYKQGDWTYLPPHEFSSLTLDYLVCRARLGAGKEELYAKAVVGVEKP